MRLNPVRLWTRGRTYGLVGSSLLLIYFVVPPIWALAKAPCGLAPTCPAPIEKGVVPALTLASFYCLLVGYFISRIIDQGLQGRRGEAGAFVLALGLFGGILWLMLHAAFW